MGVEVGTALDQGDSQATLGEEARRGAAGDAGPDDGDVEVLGRLHRSRALMRYTELEASAEKVAITVIPVPKSRGSGRARASSRFST